MQTQQVLDNLAMFVCNHNAMPYFSYPNQNMRRWSTPEMPDYRRAGGRPLSSPFPFSFTSLGLTFGGLRQATDSFVVTPINDPRKLESYRAYQKAVRVATARRGQHDLSRLPNPIQGLLYGRCRWRYPGKSQRDCDIGVPDDERRMVSRGLQKVCSAVP